MRKPINVKKLLLLNIPYMIAALLATNFGEAWRLSAGANASEKFVSLVTVSLGAAWSNPAPSLNPYDLLIGIICGAALKLAVYIRGKNAKK